MGYHKRHKKIGGIKMDDTALLIKLDKIIGGLEEANETLDNIFHELAKPKSD